MIPPKLNYGPRVPSPNGITLGAKASAHEFGWGGGGARGGQWHADIHFLTVT